MLHTIQHENGMKENIHAFTVVARVYYSLYGMDFTQSLNSVAFIKQGCVIYVLATHLKYKF